MASLATRIRNSLASLEGSGSQIVASTTMEDVSTFNPLDAGTATFDADTATVIATGRASLQDDTTTRRATDQDVLPPATLLGDSTDHQAIPPDSLTHIDATTQDPLDDILDDVLDDKLENGGTSTPLTVNESSTNVDAITPDSLVNVGDTTRDSLDDILDVILDDGSAITPLGQLVTKCNIAIVETEPIAGTDRQSSHELSPDAVEFDEPSLNAAVLVPLDSLPPVSPTDKHSISLMGTGLAVATALFTVTALIAPSRHQDTLEDTPDASVGIGHDSEAAACVSQVQGSCVDVDTTPLANAHDLGTVNLSWSNVSFTSHHSSKTPDVADVALHASTHLSASDIHTSADSGQEAIYCAQVGLVAAGTPSQGSTGDAGIINTNRNATTTPALGDTGHHSNICRSLTLNVLRNSCYCQKQGRALLSLMDVLALSFHENLAVLSEIPLATDGELAPTSTSVITSSDLEPDICTTLVSFLSTYLEAISSTFSSVLASNPGLGHAVMSACVDTTMTYTLNIKILPASNPAFQSLSGAGEGNDASCKHSDSRPSSTQLDYNGTLTASCAPAVKTLPDDDPLGGPLPLLSGTGEGIHRHLATPIYLSPFASDPGHIQSLGWDAHLWS